MPAGRPVESDGVVVEVNDKNDGPLPPSKHRQRGECSQQDQGEQPELNQNWQHSVACFAFLPLSYSAHPANPLIHFLHFKKGLCYGSRINHFTSSNLSRFTICLCACLLKETTGKLKKKNAAPFHDLLGRLDGNGHVRRPWSRGKTNRDDSTFIPTGLTSFRIIICRI